MNLWLLDDWLIYKFEKFAHKFQQQTGKTNYFLTKICYWCVLLSEVTVLVVTNGHLSGIITVIVIIAFIAYVLPREESRALKRVQDGVANPAKINPVFKFFRLMFCWVALVLALRSFFFLVRGADGIGEIQFIGSLINMLYFSFFTAGFYFSACDILPPCRGKLWDKISAFFAKPATIEAGNRTR